MPAFALSGEATAAAQVPLHEEKFVDVNIVTGESHVIEGELPGKDTVPRRDMNAVFVPDGW